MIHRINTSTPERLVLPSDKGDPPTIIWAVRLSAVEQHALAVAVQVRKDLERSSGAIRGNEVNIARAGKETEAESIANAIHKIENLAEVGDVVTDKKVIANEIAHVWVAESYNELIELLLSSARVKADEGKDSGSPSLQAD